MMKPKLVIFMDGGLIQWMYSDRPIDIARVDYDVDGAAEDELGFIVDEDGGVNSAYISLTDAKVDPEMCHNFYYQVKRQVDEEDKGFTLEREDEFGRRI